MKEYTVAIVPDSSDCPLSLDVLQRGRELEYDYGPDAYLVNTQAETPVIAALLALNKLKWDTSRAWSRDFNYDLIRDHTEGDE